MVDEKNDVFAAAQQPFDIREFEKNNQEYIEYEETQRALFYSRFWKPIEKTEVIQHQEMLNTAKQRVRELQAEIEKWEKIIDVSNRAIVRCIRQLKKESPSKAGRPIRSEYREQLVQKFTMKWVASLMVALGANGCGTKLGLEMLIPEVGERKWRRWLNGESIPPYATFEKLLGTKISRGKYADKMLCEVPVTPRHSDVSTLLQFL